MKTGRELIVKGTQSTVNQFVLIAATAMITRRGDSRPIPTNFGRKMKKPAWGIRSQLYLLYIAICCGPNEPTIRLDA